MLFELTSPRLDALEKRLAELIEAPAEPERCAPPVEKSLPPVVMDLSHVDLRKSTITIFSTRGSNVSGDEIFDGLAVGYHDGPSAISQILVTPKELTEMTFFQRLRILFTGRL